MDDILGNVAVEVSADLNKLFDGFNKGRAAADKFDKEVNDKLVKGTKKNTASTDELGQAYERITKKYRPLEVAGHKFFDELEDLNKLQKAGIVVGKEYEKIQKDIARSFQKAEVAASKSKNEFLTTANAIKGLVAVMGVQAVRALANLATETIKSNAAIGQTAAKLKITAEEFQVLNYGAKQLGITESELTSGLESLGEALAKAATGSAKEVKLLDLLGVSLKDAEGNAKSVSEILPELSDALARVPDDAQRAAAEMILFGESGAQLDELLGRGSEKIDELAVAAKELGVVLSDEQIQKSKETAIKLEALQTVLSAKIAGVVADNADSILQFADALSVMIGHLFEATSGMQRFLSQFLEMQAATNSFLLSPVMFAYDRLFGGRPSAGGSNPGNASDVSARVGFNVGGVPRTKAPIANPIDLSSLNAPKPPKGRKGPSADTLARRAERERIKALRDQKAFDDQIAREKSRQLGYEIDLSSDISEISDLERKILDIEKERFATDLQFNGPEGTKRFTAAQVEKLKILNDEIFSMRAKLIDQKEIQQLARQELDSAQARRDNEEDILQAQGSLARTAKERRRIELRILDLNFQSERAEIENLLLTGNINDAKKAELRARLAMLDSLKKLESDAVRQGTQGPMEAYLDSIPKTLDEIQEAIEQIEADKLADVGRRTIAFADDLANAFGNAARAIVNLESPLQIAQALLTDLAATFTEEFLIRPFTDFVRERAAAPLAERLIGGAASPTGLTTDQINSQLTVTSSQLQMLATATQSASLAMNNLSLGSVAPLSTETSQATTQFQQLSPQMNQFGSAIGQVMSMLGAQGGGGFLQTALGIASMAFNSGSITAGSTAALSGASNAMITANPGIFHDGGEIGPDGRPRRRQPGDVNITAQVGEHVTPRGPAKLFKPVLEAIGSGRLSDPSQLGGMFAGMMGGGGTTFSFGGITLTGVDDRRKARSAARQFESEVQHRMAKATKMGYGAGR